MNREINVIQDNGGIRTKKTVNGVDTEYFYVGDTLVSQKTANETINFAYTSGGAPYGFTYNGTSYFYLTNIQGDIIGIYDSTGTVVAEYTYDSWGKLISITGSLASTIGVKNPLRYRGYYYDNETSLYYLQSRYYDPETGRFINMDAYFVAGNDYIQGTNMYAYCYNNPVMYVDPSGHAGELYLMLLPYINLALALVEKASIIMEPFVAMSIFYEASEQIDLPLYNLEVISIVILKKDSGVRTAIINLKGSLSPEGRVENYRILLNYGTGYEWHEEYKDYYHDNFDPYPLLWFGVGFIPYLGNILGAVDLYTTYFEEAPYEYGLNQIYDVMVDDLDNTYFFIESVRSDKMNIYLANKGKLV